MSTSEGLLGFIRSILPESVRRWITLQRQKHRLQWPRAGTLNFGDLDRLTPVSAIFGFDRGQAIDRYFIEAFLASQAVDIKGHVLELGDPYYINKFGADKVTKADVLNVVESPEATIVADLTDADLIPSDSFDCIIFTQSLQMIYDMRAAIATLHRVLKPGGVLLVTSAGIAKIGRRLGRDDWGEYWHLTSQSMSALLSERFPEAGLSVKTYGNVFTASAFLYGLAAEELLPAQLEHVDPDFEVIVAARAQKM